MVPWVGRVWRRLLREVDDERRRQANGYPYGVPPPGFTNEAWIEDTEDLQDRMAW